VREAWLEWLGGKGRAHGARCALGFNALGVCRPEGAVYVVEGGGKDDWRPMDRPRGVVGVTHAGNSGSWHIGQATQESRGSRAIHRPPRPEPVNMPLRLECIVSPKEI